MSSAETEIDRKERRGGERELGREREIQRRELGREREGEIQIR